MRARGSFGQGVGSAGARPESLIESDRIEYSQWCQKPSGRTPMKYETPAVADTVDLQAELDKKRFSIRPK
jgi:hypothetical protein